MLKILNVVVCTLMFALSLSSHADDFRFHKYQEASRVPSEFQKLAGGNEFMTRSFTDDEKVRRTDKVFYTIAHDYNSTFKLEDVNYKLNPANGQLDDLFRDTNIVKGNLGFNVFMDVPKVGTATSLLEYETYQVGKKHFHKYTFNNFNMIFTGIVTLVEVQEAGPYTGVRIRQISALKGNTYRKLEKFSIFGKGALSEFESTLKKNVRKFQAGIGGI